MLNPRHSQRLVQKEEEKEEWEKSVQKYIKAKLGNRGQLVLNAQNEFLETFAETGNERKIAEGAPFLTMESIRWFPKAQDVVENEKKTSVSSTFYRTLEK